MQGWYHKIVAWQVLGLLGLFLSLFPLVAIAAAWVQPQGKRQVIHSYFFYQSDESFFENGDTIPQDKFTKHEYSIFAEYGLTSEWTIGSTVVLQYLKQESDTGTHSTYGVADTEFFVRRKLWEDEHSVVSVQPWIKVPPFDDGTPQVEIGSDHIDAEIRLLYGRNWEQWSYYHYSNVELAYRKRGGNVSDEVHLDGTVGIHPREDITLMGQVFTTLTIGEAGENGFQVINSNDYDLAKVQFSVVKDFNEEYSLQFGVFKDVWGKNTGQGEGILLSLWARF